MRAGFADAGVDGAGVVVTAGVRLDAAAHPFGGTGQAVEIIVTNDGIDGTDAGHECRRDHLRTGAVLRFGAEHEAGIVRVARVFFVVVMVDPSAQTRS
jgi:hypothetical protein